MVIPPVYPYQLQDSILVHRNQKFLRFLIFSNLEYLQRYVEMLRKMQKVIFACFFPALKGKN